MADQFKTFDKAPIVGVVNFKQWSFAIREIILAFITLVLLVLCLIFLGLYASGSSSADSVEMSASSSAAFVQKSYCVNKECLETAGRVVAMMNSSMDPCDNFYEFACGNYKTYNPTGRQGARSVLGDLSDENVDRLEEIIERPPKRYVEWAYERKMSSFFQSCQDMYRRERLKGRPFLNQILPKMGGWDLISTWDEASWDLNTVLETVQTDFWVDAFYTPHLEVDDSNTKRRVIELRPAGTGRWMYFSWYTSPYTSKVREDYKKFMRRVATLLFRDANVVNVTDDVRDARLDQFVNDTFFLESKIAATASNSPYLFDAHKEENKVQLSELYADDSGAIDWVAQLSYLFNEAEISRYTRVVVYQKSFFRNITNTINALPAQDRKRMLHHYLIWRVAEVYAQDMSWEYIHANREIYLDTRGYPNFSGVRKYCMRQVKYFMKDALGALFIQEHLADGSKQKVTDITENLRKALKSQLDKTPWMDKETKDYARAKLDSLTFKQGYPDWMTNVDHVDNMYSTMTVNDEDFFGNLVGAHKFTRRTWNKVYLMGEDRHEWPFGVYETASMAILYWNQIITTAGIMQSPVYNHNAPHFTNFGALGSSIARMLHHIVDEWGNQYDKDGEYMEETSWWSADSLNSYMPVRQCVVDTYANITVNMTSPDGSQFPVFFDGNRQTPVAIAKTNGLRLALIGYHDWVASMGAAEKKLPGLSLSADQMVFLSFAQSHCFNRKDYRSIYQAFRGVMPEDVVVNTVMGQLKEFSDTFQCSKKAKLNKANRCDYY